MFVFQAGDCDTGRTAFLVAEDIMSAISLFIGRNDGIYPEYIRNISQEDPVLIENLNDPKE